jgi:hypothetical protein
VDSQVRAVGAAGTLGGVTGGGGRWEALFADLDAEWEAAERHDLDAEVADRSRAEFAAVRLVDRLRPALGGQIVLVLVDGTRAEGVLRAVGPDWLLLATPRPVHETLVPLGAVGAVSGLTQFSAAPGTEGAVTAGLGLRSALRRLARSRVPSELLLRGGVVLHGTCDRVGQDFLELAEHPPNEPRRVRAVRTVHTVPFSALLGVRSR